MSPQIQSGQQQSEQRLQVAHVASQRRGYPGEQVTFHTRVQLGADLPGFRLRINLPAGLEFTDYQLVAAPAETRPRISRSESGQAVTWDVVCRQAEPGHFEARTVATILPARQDTELDSLAVALSRTRDGQMIRHDESTSLIVRSRGRYLEHLPALYQEDELMGRFLMLFESFLGPITHQIGTLHLYFDPQLTPPRFLPWLATWLDLQLDEQWPEVRQRQLLQMAAALNRSCGTRAALQRYLEIYSGGRARIVEHRAHRFQLGREARLGSGLALGTSDQAHTFSVYLRLPPLANGDVAAASRAEAARRRKLESIIQAHKPAHTTFQLYLEVDPGLETVEPFPPLDQPLSPSMGTDNGRSMAEIMKRGDSP